MEESSEQYKQFRLHDTERKASQVEQVKQRLGIAITKSDEELSKSWEDLQAEQPAMSDIYRRTLIALGRERHGEVIPTQQILDDRLKVLQLHLRDFIMHHGESDVSSGVLRPHQMEVFEAITDSLEDGNEAGYVKLPTGTGKTILFTKFLEAARMKTLLVVPSKVLVKQTGESVEQFTTDLDLGKIYSESKKHGEDVTITTYDSLVSNVTKGTIKPEDYGLLILDEAHRSLSKARKKAVNAFTQSLKLGFTATPRFNEEKQVSNLLPNEIYSMSIEEAVNRGIIAPFLPYVVETSLDLSNVSVQAGEYNFRELEKAVNTRGRNLAAVEVYKSRPELRDKTAVAYCVGVSHATALAHEFMEQGVAAAVISGSTSENDRIKILEAYKNGDIQVLCNADLLIEGFDEPRASVCLNLRPTQSLVVAEQRAGRVLRLDKDNPEKLAYVIDFLDSGGDRKKSPLLFTDIVNMNEINAPKSESDVISTGEEKEETEKDTFEIEGVQVSIHVLLDDVLNITNHEKKTVMPENQTKERVISWLTWEEIQEIYKLPDEVRVLIQHSAEWRPETKRERIQADGTELTEYHPHAIERACSKVVINEILDNINDFVEQDKVISVPFIKIFMEETMLVDTELVIEFMQYLASEEKKSVSDPILLKDRLENQRFVKRLRDFHQLLSSTNQNSQRIIQAGKDARELVA